MPVRRCCALHFHSLHLMPRRDLHPLVNTMVNRDDRLSSCTPSCASSFAPRDAEATSEILNRIHANVACAIYARPSLNKSAGSSLVGKYIKVLLALILNGQRGMRDEVVVEITAARLPPRRSPG